MVTILLFLLLLAWGVSTFAVFLWLGARWLKIPNITFKRSMAGVVLILIVEITGFVGFTLLGARADLALALAEVGVGLLLSSLLIARLFRTSFGKAILAWLVLLIPAGINYALVFPLIKPFVLEGFIMPTNSSAPTLIGYHKDALCPHCAGVMVVPYDPQIPNGPGDGHGPHVAICRACLRTGEVMDTGPEPGPPDRFVCNKLLFPRRWDLAIFRAPSNPSDLWVKRLVGLPGETVHFQDGALWIDGKKLDPPAEIAKLKIGDGDEFTIGWGAPDRPAHLGPDEYFVVGDFGLRSSDSRNWRERNDGHPSYALPRSNIVGVATVIYWPPSRWRIFR
jgi:signal peptidase I